jgi:predicted Rdx family selenoprotein
MPHAARVAAAIKQETGLETEFIPGAGGILHVELDGEVVWTNDDRRGVKPANEEVIEPLKKMLGA